VAALLHSWRYFFAFIALLGLVGLFYYEENWRGPRAWNKYKSRSEARGERFDASGFVPAMVPPSENFAMTPFLAPMFDFIPGTQKWRSTNTMAIVGGFAPEYDRAARAVKASKGARSNSWLTSEIDLVAWRQAYLQSTNRINQPAREDARPTDLAVSRKEAAEAVLANLEECSDVVEELRESSKRKYSRFNLQYNNEDPAAILLPHLAVLKHICQVLQLRATAELALGKTDEAFSDVKLMFHVEEASRNEPILISQFVRMPMLYMTMELIADGFGRWSEPQLKEFEQELQEIDFCTDVKRALDAERVLFGGGIIEFLRREPDKFEALSGDGNFPGAIPGAIWSAVPNGWFDLEKMNYTHLFDEFVLPSIDLTNRRVNPTACKQLEQRMTAILNKSHARLFLQHRAFCSLLVPGVLTAARKTAFGQTAADTAAIACAVERFKLARGKLPESLEELVPQFMEKLPHDVITGQPLKYMRTEDGHYAIYSLGWNEKDDGGVTGFKKGAADVPVKKGEHDVPEEGDWVWR
jgi:Bacterial type II secretion system protein G.